ncbi:MAG: zf-HC2 domain-containing protein [Oscillospiraceae bacterium]|nr:zf-HC2 domain-containing protein [Oscillospiraceae bacterium]
MHEYYRMLVSAAVDGEATEAELAELNEHIAGCPECAALLEAYTAVGAELADEAEPPAKLAEGVMFRVKNEKKKRRFAFGRFTAIAAAAIVIIFAGRFALGGLFRAGSSAPKDAGTPEGPSAVESVQNDVSRGPLATKAPEGSLAADAPAAPDSYDVSEEPSSEQTGLPGSTMGHADPRTAELMLLVLDHPDEEAIYVVPADAAEQYVANSASNALSGGNWYEVPAEEGRELAESADQIVYMTDGAENCIVVVYYD